MKKEVPIYQLHRNGVVLFTAQDINEILFYKFNYRFERKEADGWNSASIVPTLTVDTSIYLNLDKETDITGVHFPIDYSMEKILSDMENKRHLLKELNHFDYIVYKLEQII